MDKRKMDWIVGGVLGGVLGACFSLIWQKEVGFPCLIGISAAVIAVIALIVWRLMRKIKGSEDG